MTGRILCNLSFLYNKKRHGRILFFHTYYLFLYSTEYTFFSIICVSCTYFPLKENCIHSIHAYHLYLILHQAQENPDFRTGQWQCQASVSYPEKNSSLSFFLYRTDRQAPKAHLSHRMTAFQESCTAA